MLVSIRQDLGHTLSTTEQEVIVSATTVGAIVGALVAGRLSDWLGRKKVMVISGIFFTLGSIEQSASQIVRELVLGRVLVGLGVGMASMIVPTYLAECAPTSIRGRIIAINSLLITGGQVIAYTVDAAFYSLPHGWRWMVLAGGVPALVQLVGLFYLDESPRWLVSRGRHSSARHVLGRIYPFASAEAISNQIQHIEQSLNGGLAPAALPAPSSSASTGGKASNLKKQLSALWFDRGNRKALLLSCGLQAAQQLVGANSILYFSSRLLLMAGFKTNPNAAAISIAVANLLGTAIALRLVDRIGRRRLLLNATAAATIALACLAIALSQIDTGDVTDSEGVASADAHPPAGPWAYISLFAVSTGTRQQLAWPPLTLPIPAQMVFFLFFYALGLGIVPWLVQSEVFSGDVRGVGGGLATATNWTCNLIISATYLDLVRGKCLQTGRGCKLCCRSRHPFLVVTPAGSFGLFAGVGAATWLFAYLQLPELSGVSINDVQSAMGGSSYPNTRAGYTAVPRQVNVADDGSDDDDDGDGRNTG